MNFMTIKSKTEANLSSLINSFSLTTRKKELKFIVCTKNSSTNKAKKIWDKKYSPLDDSLHPVLAVLGG